MSPEPIRRLDRTVCFDGGSSESADGASLDVAVDGDGQNSSLDVNHAQSQGHSQEQNADQSRDGATAKTAEQPTLELPSGPTPDCGAERVVRGLISTLEAADPDPDPAVALRPVFGFATPRFRSQWGSLEGFVSAFSSPIYEPFYMATSFERGPLERTDGRVIQKVLARGEGGPRTYELTLRLQTDGKYDGCWMIDALVMIYNGESPAFRRMATVNFEGTAVRCPEGAPLRDVLLRAEGRSPYNDVAQVANCGGNGLCGTCAVSIEGEVDAPGRRETRRLSLPPHDGSDSLRLSCQTCVQGDLVVEKHDGLWGQHLREQGAEEADDRTLAEPIPVTEAEYDGACTYRTVETETDSSGRAETESGSDAKTDSSASAETAPRDPTTGGESQ